MQVLTQRPASVVVASFRFLITMIHKTTGEEELLDVVLNDDSLSSIYKAVREKFSYAWEIFEILDCDCPF